MQIYIHEKKAKRKGNIGKIAIFTGLALLGLGFYISLQRDASTVLLLIVLAFVGTVVTQFGSIWFAKYGQSPRPDEVLSESLKGLSNNHALFHYSLNTDHALLGPSSAAAVIAYQVNGTITYENGNYFARGSRGLFGGSRKRKLRGIERNAKREVKELTKVLHWAFPNRDDFEVHPLLVFVNDNVNLDLNEPPIPTAHAKKAKNVFKHIPASTGFSAEEIAILAEKRGFREATADK